MSRYKIPTMQFGKLDLEGKPKRSRHGNDVMPVITRSAKKHQNHASSSQPSSSSTTRPRQSSTAPTSHPSTSHANRQHLPPVSQGLNADEGDSEEDDDEEDGDGNNADGDGDEDDNDEEAAARERRNTWRIKEFMSLTTDMILTPWELPDSPSPLLEIPDAVITLQTRLMFVFTTNLITRLSTNQVALDAFLSNIDRADVVTAIIARIDRQWREIRDQFWANVRDPNVGSDVDETVTALGRWQMIVETFLRHYGGGLTNAHPYAISTILVNFLHFIAGSNWDPYASHPNGRRDNSSDVDGGNIYEKWRIRGRSDRRTGDLPWRFFQILLLPLARHAQAGGTSQDDKIDDTLGRLRGNRSQIDTTSSMMEEALGGEPVTRTPPSR